MAVTVKLIVPKGVGFDLDKFKSELDRTLIKTGVDLKRDFQATVSTWKSQPVFRVLRKPDSVTVITDDPVYYYLTFGTRKRWAIMSPNFAPKTAKGKIQSGPGRGRAIIVGKRAMLRRRQKARKGITARLFHITITEKNEPKFRASFDKAIKSSLTDNPK